MDKEIQNAGIKRKRNKKLTEEEKLVRKRERNRLKMKRYRDRVKEKHKNRDEEIDNLKSQIEALTNENEELKAKITILNAESVSANCIGPNLFKGGKQSAFEKIESAKDTSVLSHPHLSTKRNEKQSSVENIFKREYRFWKDTLPELIDKNPDKINYSLIHQNRDIADANGAARLSYLKSQFKNIVQNALPFGALATLFNFDSFEFSEWSKYKEECEKPNPDFSGIKIPPGFKNQNISKEAVDFLRKHGKEHVAILRDIRVLVQSLVKIRNRLLIKFQEFIDSFDNSDYRYGKVDHVAVKKKWEDYRQKGVDLFTIMRIKKKDPDAEYRSEVEMTEFDDEDSPLNLDD
ncbi:unnamed protein product [Moneuplotes crassus]|uniref:BZIP domain-containing protein n=1 Tax=Euplotes crassus TaxID=5936 RepID=A0AAD1UJU4_EUPCR|nr:unnamed protein product [Moneuplotes crassus]